MGNIIKRWNSLSLTAEQYAKGFEGEARGLLEVGEFLL